MPTKEKKSTRLSTFEKINSFQKFIICLGIAVIAYFSITLKDVDSLTHLMIGWNAFSVCMIVMSCITFKITNSKQIREQAKIQDPKSTIIFIIVLVATLAGFLAVLLLIISKSEGNHDILRVPIAVGGMLLSWILIHIIFTLRYAHIYYGNHEINPDIHAGGLDFPGGERPEYPDFAYFSFVLGMTFQVSDVQITSKRLRKLALIHGLLSFGFNTIMIALTINLIAGYGG